MIAERYRERLRPLAILTAVCVMTWLVRHQLDAPITGIDDANIFLVYARNISAGEGFVFNVGAERVEGFTSLLWVLICAAATPLPGGPERWLLALNVLLVSLTINGCFRSSIFRRSAATATISGPWAMAFVVLLLSDYRYVAWSTVALMETALWSATITAAILLLTDQETDRAHSIALAGVIGLMLVTRPEALLWAPAVLGLYTVRTASLSGRLDSWRRARPGIVVYLLVAGSLTLFRLAYFGFPLPNTYYAKVSPSFVFSATQGGAYLLSYIASGPVPFAAMLSIILSALHLVRVRCRDTRTLAFTAMAFLALSIPAVTGGDHFGGHRFYQPAYPVLLLCFFNFLRFVAPHYLPSHVPHRRMRHAVVAGTGALGALYLVVLIGEWTQFEERLSMGRELAIADVGRRRGSSADRLFEELNPRPTIGTITVGGFKYAYNGAVLDLMGLNNTRMAHNGGTRIGVRSHAAFEKDVFYELGPTAVIPLVQESNGTLCMQAKSPFVDLVLKGLLDDARFRATYMLAEVRRTTPTGILTVAAWYDRQFLGRLSEKKEFEIIIPDDGAYAQLAACSAHR